MQKKIKIFRIESELSCQNGYRKIFGGAYENKIYMFACLSGISDLHRLGLRGEEGGR
jgi:hypothetical protein